MKKIILFLTVLILTQAFAFDIQGAYPQERTPHTLKSSQRLYLRLLETVAGVAVGIWSVYPVGQAIFNNIQPQAGIWFDLSNLKPHLYANVHAPLNKHTAGLLLAAFLIKDGLTHLNKELHLV